LVGEQEEDADRLEEKGLEPWRAGKLDWSSRSASPLRIWGATGHTRSPFPSFWICSLVRYVMAEGVGARIPRARNLPHGPPFHLCALAKSPVRRSPCRKIAAILAYATTLDAIRMGCLASGINFRLDAKATLRRWLKTMAVLMSWRLWYIFILMTIEKCFRECFLAHF
jgi:hypothetical protein